MKTKIISILWWSLTHPLALLTTLAKLSCSLAIIFALVVSVCEIKIDFIEQGKKALISEIFNAGYSSSSNTNLTVASLRDYVDYDYDFDCDYESNLSFKIDPELEQQLAAATDMHHDFDYSQPIIAPLGSQERFSLSDSTVFNLDKNINSGISYQNFNDKGFALIDSINEYTKAHPELQNNPHYQARIKAQIAQIYFNSTLLPEHMSADIGLANTIAAITEQEAPALEPAPASNSRANKNKVALPQEFAHNSQETLPIPEPITEPITKQITKPSLAANALASNHEAHSPYGYQDTDYSNDNQNAYQHHNCQKNNSLYSSNFTSNSLNGSYNHGQSQSQSQSHGNSYSHSPITNQHESELKSTTHNNLNRNLKNTRDDLYLAQEGKVHHQKSLASTNSALKGQTYVYSHSHNLKPNQALKSLSPNSRSSSNYALEPNANLAMNNTPNSALTNHGLMSSDGILEEEEEELVLALPDSKPLTPSQAATITTSSASHNPMLNQGHNLSHEHGMSQGHDHDLSKSQGLILSVSQNQGLSHSLNYGNSFEQEPTLTQTKDAYYSQANTNKIASDKTQLCLSASKSLGATISASQPTALTNSSVTSTAPNPFASLSSLASLASANSSHYSGSTLSMANIATSGSNSSYHHNSQSASTTLSSSTSTSSSSGSSTLSSSISSNIHPNSNLNNTNSYHNNNHSNSNSNNSSTGISSSQNDSSHYAIALAPTMTNNAMSTDHTISTAMVTALTTNTDHAAISTSISTSINTATITANTDVSATGTTATGPATTITCTDIAPTTATGTITGTATATVIGTTANGLDGLATTNTIGTSNGIGSGTGNKANDSYGLAATNTIGTSNGIGIGSGTTANGLDGLAATNTIGTSNSIGTATATVTGTTANGSDGLATANKIGTSNGIGTATGTDTTANGSDGLAAANTIGTSNGISTATATGTSTPANGSEGLATATGTGTTANGSDGLATANTISTSNGIGTGSGTVISGTGTTANDSEGLATANTIGTSNGTATATCTGTTAYGSNGLATVNTIGTSNGIGTGSGTVISGTGTTANGSDGLATANTIGTSNGIGTGTATCTGNKANGSYGLVTANTIGTSNSIGTVITNTVTITGTATSIGRGTTGAANSEVAYLYRLDEELFDEEVEKWDLEALQQLDLVIEDPEISLTAQDYQIIDEVMSTIDELRASGIAVDLDTVQMLCEHYMPQPYGTILLNNTKHEHLLSLLKSKQAKEQAKLSSLQPKESLVTELKDHSHPSESQLDASLGAISNLATEQANSLSKVNAHTGTNYTTKSGSQPSWGHSVFSVTNMVADDYIASMALESNTLYASLNTNMGANLGSPYSNALAYNYHDRLKSFNSSHSTSDSHSPAYNPNGAPVAEIAPAAIDTQVTSPAETNTATTGGNLSLDDACKDRVGEEASLNFEDFGIKEVAPVTPLMTPKQEPNNFLLLPKPIVLSKEGIVGLFSYPKRPVITQDALVINMRTYEKTYGSDYKQCLQMLGHWPDIQSLLNNYEYNGAKELTPAALGIIKINNMLNAHHYWSDPLNISTTFFSLYHYCKDLDSGLIAPKDRHGIDVLKQLYVLSINSPSTLWCSPAHMLTYKQVTKHSAQDSNNGQAIFANSNVASSLNHSIPTQAASAPVPSLAEMNFKAQSESQAIDQAQLKNQTQAKALLQHNVPRSSYGSIFYQGKGQELAPRYGKELAPTVESELELGYSQGHGYGQVPSNEQALREEQHYESLLDDTNNESNYYGLREQVYHTPAHHQSLNQGYSSSPNSSPSSSSQQGSSNLLGQKPYQEQGNWSGNSHGYSHGHVQDYAHGQGLGWENSKDMERNKSFGMDYSREYDSHSPEAMMGTVPYEQSKQDGIELLGRTFNNSDDAKQALDQALGLSTAYDKHSYSTNHISYQTNALNGVKPLATASYNPTDLNEALDKQLIFNDLSYELMLPVYESLTEYQQAILESCQPWLLNKKLLSYDKERAFASILQNLTKLIKLKVLSPKEAYALAHGQRPKLLKEQDIVAFAIIGQIVKQAHENHQGKFTKEQAHDLKLLKQALYYAKWPLLEQCIDPNFAYRYSKIRLKYGYQGQIINPLSFITDTFEPQPQPHLSHSPSSNISHGYSLGYGYNLSSSNNIAQSTGLGLSPSTGTGTGIGTGNELSSGHKLSTRAKSNLGSRWESEAMGHAHRQQHKQPEQQLQQQMLQQQQQQLMRQYGNALAMNGNQIVNEHSCQEDNAQVFNEVLNTAQNLRSMYQDLKTLEHGDILNSAQTIINAANRVGNNLPLNKSSTNAANSIPNQSSIADINQVFATGPAPGTNTTDSTQSPTQ